MRTSENFSRRDGLLVLLLAGLVALFFWRILTPNPADRAQFPPGDFTDQFYAFRVYQARALAAGRLPLWSENLNSGHPFLADVQAAVFYPIALLNTLINVALLGPNFSLYALEFEAVLHFFLAGTFTYLFARRVIQSRAGAFAAAIVFIFGGYLTSYPPLQLAILETATWLPLALFFLDRVATDLTPSDSPFSPPLHFGDLRPQREGGRGVRSIVYAGIVLGIASLAGHPQTFLFVLGTSAIYFVFRMRAIYRVASTKGNPSRRVLSVLMPLGTVFLIAFGLAAAQWIPSLEYQQLSTREALSFREAAAGFPTLDLLQFIFPGFVSAFASPLYVGILPLWLAVVALARRDRNRIFWGLLALGALIVAFGFYVFGYVLLYLFVPGAVLFRQQERLALVVSFALAMLAGYGLRDVLAFASSSGVKWARRVFPLLLAGAAISFALLITFFAAGVSQPTGRLAFLGDRAGLMFLLFGLASMLVGAYLTRRISPHAWTGLALALMLFDLFSVDEPANRASPTQPYPANPLVERVQQEQGIFRIADEGQMPGHFGIGYRLEEIGGISPLRLAHYAELLQLPPAKLWPLLNVRYVFTERPQFKDAVSVAQDGKTRLLRLDNTLPRAWIVGMAEVEPDDARALQRMQSDDVDLGRTVLLASPPPFAPGAQSTRSIKFETREPERVALTADVIANGLLVLSENFYPGWTARVDGVPVEILRADVSLRAIPLRAGAHRVELIYDPLSVKIGIALSILTLLGCIILVLKSRRG